MTLLTQIISRILKEHGLYKNFRLQYDENNALGRIQTINRLHFNFTLNNILSFSHQLFLKLSYYEKEYIESQFRVIIWGFLQQPIKSFCISNNITNMYSVNRNLIILNNDSEIRQFRITPWNFILLHGGIGNEDLIKIQKNFRKMVSRLLIQNDNEI